MGTHEKDESSFERRSRVVRHGLRSDRRFGSSTTFARMALQNSTPASDRLTKCTRGVRTKRAGSNEIYRAEDAPSAGMAEFGTTANPQRIASRQSSRPHDRAHDSRETDQAWTSCELARITFRRLEPTGTVTSDHRLTAHGRNLRTTMETGIDDSPQPSTSNSIDKSGKCRWRGRAMTSQHQTRSWQQRVQERGCRTCSALNAAKTCGTFGEACVGLDRRPFANIAEHGSIFGKDDIRSETELVDVAGTCHL